MIDFDVFLQVDKLYSLDQGSSSYEFELIILQSMSGVEDKDKKIADLRALLTQAKAKIEEYKAQVVQKEKEGEQSKKQYEKKIRLLEAESQNIITQYEQRLLRYQKTIEDADSQVENHKKNALLASRHYDELNKRISNLYLIASKVFAPASREKESSDAVEELCQIEKCKEFAQSLERLSEGAESQALGKLILQLVKANQTNLGRRREQRIQFVKRETLLSKNVEEQKGRSRNLQAEIDALRKELSEVRDRHQRQIEAIAASKQKQQQQRTNEQFVKQLLIKVIVGPKDASMMALGILGKVLKFSEEELRQCEKKIK